MTRKTITVESLDDLAQAAVDHMPLFEVAERHEGRVVMRRIRFYRLKRNLKFLLELFIVAEGATGSGNTNGRALASLPADVREIAICVAPVRKR
jgi:hypothetical protein